MKKHEQSGGDTRVASGRGITVDGFAIARPPAAAPILKHTSWAGGCAAAWDLLWSRGLEAVHWVRHTATAAEDHT